MHWDSFCWGAGIVLVLRFAEQLVTVMGQSLGRFLARLEIRNVEKFDAE